ncbi:hypothetical protein BH11PSE12_BH11PSE12_30400 [soil metagenome]
MKTENTQAECLSSLVDGELSGEQSDLILLGLDEVNGLNHRNTWCIYHQIGDVLRSDDLALPLSADFSSRFSARLAAEPVVLAPRVSSSSVDAGMSGHNVIALAAARPRIARYMAMSSMAAAVAVAFFMAPQIIPLINGQSGSALQMSQVRPSGDAGSAGVQLVSAMPQSGVASENLPDKVMNQVEMLRDPRLDSYLLAHQKFSPSISSGSQYVTRANTVTNSVSHFPSSSAPAQSAGSSATEK